MLKTSNTKSAEPKKSVVRVGGDNRAGHDRDELDKSEIDDVDVDGGKVEDNEIGKKG